MPFGLHTRLCPACNTLLPDPPAPPACPQCGRVACPHHTEWPPVVKWFLMAMFIRSMLMAWQSEQELWENLLRSRLVPGGKGPNPHGTHLNTSTPTADLYPLAVLQSQAWKAEGSPIFAPDPAPSPQARRTA